MKKPGDVMIAGRRLGLAMTSLVVTQDAKWPAQRPRLFVPHRQIGRERIAESAKARLEHRRSDS
jgi:hypothetical protein